MPQLLINLLGPPRIEVDGQPIDINRRKAVAILAYLAATGQPHTRDALAALFWPESDQKQARAGLRSALWALNKAGLDRWLTVEADRVSLLVDSSVAVDVVRFEALFAETRQHGHSADQVCAICKDLLREAAALYTDDFLAGFSLPDAPDFDDWQFFQTGALRQSLTGALEKLITLLTEENKYAEAIPFARRWTALEPLHEPAHQTLMTLYAQTGQQPAALRQFEILNNTLEKEIGVKPASESLSLYESIRQGEMNGRNSSRLPRLPIETAEPTRPINRHNLPQLPAPLIGRREELASIAAFLAEPTTRLVTLLGPGGIGKTRLSLSAAFEQLSLGSFSDGVFFVSLLSTDSTAGLPAVIADAIGYPVQQDGRSPTAQLADFLASKKTLLILDNFEHLLAGAESIAALLNRAPELNIIATSREPLKLEGEQQFPLHGLAIPEEDTEEIIVESESAKLFLQSARRRRPDFNPSDDALAALARICRLLEGMPLALKLAAAWIDVLSLDEIAAEIEQSLDFLEGDLRTLPSRHRSMRAVFKGSWERLSPSVKETYARLAIFRDGFTREAAEAVTGANFRTLAGLLNKSLVSYWQHPGRYDIHNLLHQYALEKLKSDFQPDAYQDARDAHAAYYAHFLERAGSEINGPRQLEVVQDIENDLENILFAWQRALEAGRADHLDRMNFPLCLYFYWNARVSEALAHLEPAAAALQETAPASAEHLLVLVRLLNWMAVFHMVSAQFNQADDHLQQASALLDGHLLADVESRADRAMTLMLRSEIAKNDDFGGRALELNRESLALYHEVGVGDGWGISQAIYFLGGKLQSLGRYEEAIALEKENLALQEKLGSPRGIALAYNSLGHYELFANHLDQSERHLRQSLALTRELGIPADVRRPLLILGINLLFAGKFEESKAAFAECVAIHRDLAIPHEPGSASVGIARCDINLGRYRAARERSGDDLQRYRRLELNWYISFALFNLARIDLIDGQIDSASAQLAEGIELLKRVNDRPLLTELLLIQGLAFHIKGDRSSAEEHLKEGIALVLDTGELNTMRFELGVMALMQFEDGETEHAVEIYAAARQSPYIANSVWWATVAGQKIATAAAELPPDVAEAARGRGQERDLRKTAEELLEGLR